MEDKALPSPSPLRSFFVMDSREPGRLCSTLHCSKSKFIYILIFILKRFLIGSQRLNHRQKPDLRLKAGWQQAMSKRESFGSRRRARINDLLPKELCSSLCPFSTLTLGEPTTCILGSFCSITNYHSHSGLKQSPFITSWFL